MRKVFRIARRWGFAIVTFLLVGCTHDQKTEGATAGHPKAAVLTAFADVSLSTAAVNDPAYATRVSELVGRDYSRSHIGDLARVVVVGDRSAAHAASTILIASGYSQRIPTAQRKLVAALESTFQQYRGSQGEETTNLLYSLENSRPFCTPGSRVVLISDGVESSDNYSASEPLASGKPVNLPAPSGPYLRGCTAAIYGLGMSADGRGGSPQALPNRQLAALEAGWRAYFTEAGVRPEDISFASIL